MNQKCIMKKKTKVKEETMCWTCVYEEWTENKPSQKLHLRSNNGLLCYTCRIAEWGRLLSESLRVFLVSVAGWPPGVASERLVYAFIPLKIMRNPWLCLRHAPMVLQLPPRKGRGRWEWEWQLLLLHCHGDLRKTNIGPEFSLKSAGY